jgi:hypothetical protein
MTKEEFGRLFSLALGSAADAADKQVIVPITRSYLIELHAPGHPGDRIEVEDALDSLYLGESHFYRIIDVAIIALTPKRSVAFVRVSGHAPVSFEKTWNPKELGPFKLMEVGNIKDQRDPP